MTIYRQLVEADTGQVLIPRVEMANGFFSRLRGLQFRRPLPAGTGLLMTPCASMHTCFVRFPLDLVMLDRDLRVVGVRRDVKPWRLVFAPCGTRSILETTAGQCPAVALGVKLALA